MWVLLPPSETKRRGGEDAERPLAFSATLHTARNRVRAALETLSQHPDAARRALKLGVKNQDEFRLNLSLEASPKMPAIERYTGVVYDALEMHTLDSPAQDWVNTHVFVQSALFGLISAQDWIPAYRLSAGTSLPGIGHSLKQVWRHAHTPVWPSAPYVLDLRAKAYVDLAPLPEGAGDTVNVMSRDADGTLRALNHFNKAGKGAFVRALAQSAPHIEHRTDLLVWAEQHGIDLAPDPAGGLRLITTLGVPGAPQTIQAAKR